MNKEQTKARGASAMEGSMRGYFQTGTEPAEKPTQASDEEIGRTVNIVAAARSSYRRLLMEGFRERMKKMFAEDAEHDGHVGQLSETEQGRD